MDDRRRIGTPLHSDSRCACRAGAGTGTPQGALAMLKREIRLECLGTVGANRVMTIVAH